MTKQSCSVSVCDREAVAQGLCVGHYARWRKYGDPGDTPLNSYGKNDRRTCKEDGCDRGVYAKWLCRTHYNIAFGYSEYTGRGRKWRTGERKWEGVECKVEGCSRPVKTDGWCTMHYARIRKNGEAGGPQRLRGGHGDGHVNHNGYREVPNPNGGKALLEHRLVMECTLGRKLFKGENVHHINGVRADNRPENLELWVTSQPSGQRPQDLVAWAREILDRYESLVESR